MPFLTQLDPNARIKGSRDPLGVQAVWTLLGREVVPNLSTVTTAVRDFTATMIGYAFAQHLEGREESAVTIFLRWEQWAAYSRAFHFRKEAALRGIERVRMEAEKGNVRISAAREHQILSNQKTYGLWGLYSMPSEKSGLVETKAVCPTPDAWKMLESVCWPRLKPLAAKLAQPLCRVSLEKEPLVDVIALEVLKPHFSKLERSFYTRHLLEQSADQRLAVLTMPEVLRVSRPELSPPLLREWRDRAAGHSSTLAENLERVRVAETVLAPAVWLFSWLLGRDGQKLAAVEKDLRQEWGTAFAKLEVDAFAKLRGYFKNGTSDGWLRMAEAMKAADYRQLVLEVTGLCSDVMKQRGGSAWITMEAGALRVHAQEKPAALVSRARLSELWTHSYFLDSLAVVAAALKED
ncbi:MAG: hypothetical protein IAE77_10320 [Prosthecobacter sp.]|jgi:hypothetical protein|uniref:hypothetical protein n=1 Tax=Prosthecobacter sp. TaxID=1965333 RepID=UPI0019FC55BE|nr:hypothetical protein [Prosthecobacter sp.]MBE2283839.1 hypothetical protein [Prosthecobacter sp.]